MSPSTHSLLDELEQEAGTPEEASSFRQRATRVGVIYTMTYQRARVAVFDFDREKAGGLPRGGFLIAAKQEAGPDFILLRILSEASLPNASLNDQTRQQAVEGTGNSEPWADRLDDWTKNRLSLHALECRVLGTYIQLDDGSYRFAEDTDNYYAVSDLMVWKPDAATLELIVNHRHRKNSISMGDIRYPIGKTRFSAAERSETARANILLNPTDLFDRRTVYLGMSRSGKSNAMKVTAEAIYRLREHGDGYRIGQLIFDPNGEYAQDNPQDGPGLHRIHESLGLDRKDEVETYGLFPAPSDPRRTIMKLNFFGDAFPHPWSPQGVELALDQLLAGRNIVQEIMADEDAKYLKAFRDADISIPPSTANSRSAQVRYRRAILAYQTALAAAGLAAPSSWAPSTAGLFSKDLIDALKFGKNQPSPNRSTYDQAAQILEASKKRNGSITWSQLETVFSALNQFIGDPRSNYEDFERSYIAKSTTGTKWADPKLQNLLRIFESQNGPRSFQKARDQHEPNAPQDFAGQVVEDLRNGKLVVVDQSTGDPDQNRWAAERIMWRVFRAQQDSFRNAATAVSASVEQPHVLVYVEEAHNLLPRVHGVDTLRTVWARAAKEGSKMNLGMVLATQAPSSIMPEILSETDNWILAYINSRKERSVVEGYLDFGDFVEQIGQVSEPGFVRLRTLSLAYTVPVQFHRFRLDLNQAP